MSIKCVHGEPDYCSQCGDLSVEAKDARIAELEERAANQDQTIEAQKAALAKAEEALNAFQEDHGCCPTCGRYINGEDHTKGCLYGAALAGIKETRHD